MFSKLDKKLLLIYSGLALLFIYPLIQAGIYYRDDLDRSISGYYGWRGLGRPFADILARFFLQVVITTLTYFRTRCSRPVYF